MIRLDRHEALRYLHYEGQVMDEALKARFEQAVSACEEKLQPRSTHACFAIDYARSDARQVALEGCSLLLEGADIVHHVQGATEVALMACTLGAAFEREMGRRVALSPTDGLLFDAAASALIETVANEEQAALAREVATRGLQPNFRFSPGYGDFPLHTQPAFLAVLDAPRRIGLSVTETHLLVPTKSITAVVGLFAGEPPRQAAGHRVCEICSLKENCLLKSSGRTCHG